MKIVMTFVVRDEADVLEVNLRVHRALGVDAFAVLDNGSTDGTAEILARWREAGLAHVTTDPAADTDEVFRQWQTRLAKLAASELGADWVINNDGDEFWWPLTGNLKEAFAAVPPESNGILAPRLEFVPRPDGPEAVVGADDLARAPHARPAEDRRIAQPSTFGSAPARTT